MAASLSTIAAKDGNGTLVSGALQALDLSGAGTGPWSLANILVDGVVGTLRAQVTAANALKVDGSAVTQPVSGTVTANAGTNLNTSALALETGGNLATLAGTVSAAAIAVRQATAASLNATVVGTGTFAVQAAATLNAETTKVIGTVRNLGNAGAIFDFAGQNASSPANSILMGAQFNTTPTTITTGNASPLQVDNAGNLLVNIKAGAGSGGTALQDEATFTEGTTSFTPIGGVFKTSHTNLTTGQGGAVALSAAREMFTLGKVWDGTNIAAVKAASTSPGATDPALVVSLSPNSNGLVSTGTQASPSSAYLSTIVAGDIAAAATDSGNPVKIGGIANSATPTKVTAAQRANAWIGLRGELIAQGNTRENKGVTHTTITSSTSPTTIIAAIASTFCDLYGLILTNSSVTACAVTITDNATVEAVIEVPAGDTRGFMLPIDSGIPQVAVNHNWTATCGTSVASIDVTALWVKNT